MASFFDVDLDNQPQTSIFMVPRIYRDQNPSCFDPLEVSIGPFHKGNSNVQANEALKRKYMRDLLVRLKSPPQQTLERCFSKVNSLINEIKLCYGGMLNCHDSDVANIMVIDSCFILELVQKMFEGDCSGNMFMRLSILWDLLRIENQIPFFVLQNIFDLTLLEIQQKNSLITLLIDHVFFGFHPFKAKLKIDNNGNDVCNYKHILDILHKSCRPDLLAEYGLPKAISHSVVELDRAGLMFKPNQGRSMAMAIEYELFGVFGKPTLRMPVLTIDDTTELVLWNLIAYEQSYPNVDGHYFTSFVVALDMLVDSTWDVVKLVESEVIVNRGSNEKAAKMIKGMCRGVVCRTFMYQRVFQQLDNYYKWANNRGWLKLFYDPRWDQFLGPNKAPSLFGLGTCKNKLKSC